MQSSTRCLKIIILFCNVSEIFVRSINFVVFVLFKASVVKVSVWRRFYCSQKMFVDFVETAFICLSSRVTVRDTHCFFLNLQIRRPQHHELYTIKIIAKFRLSKKILIQDFAKLRKFCSRLHFYHFGTLPLILLKWEQPQKWKRQRQPKWNCGLVLETKIVFWLLIRKVEVACFDIHCLTFVSWENGEDKKNKDGEITSPTLHQPDSLTLSWKNFPLWKNFLCKMKTWKSNFYYLPKTPGKALMGQRFHEVVENENAWSTQKKKVFSLSFQL